MSRQNSSTSEKVHSQPQPRSLALAEQGIATAPELASFLSAIMTDVIRGALHPATANASVNAAGKLLKVAEMQIKYGKPNGTEGQSPLRLCGQEEAPQGDGGAADAEAEAEAVAIDRRKRKLALIEELARLEADD